ncbi:hypothetical protein NQ166_03125 [Microbacterium sp. zg.Y1090]|uniref:DUF7882 family protein n=1 Tax=Microbacterium TaxID=33882 RepID=UPI00214AD2E1|nr:MULTISPECIES: hypothetical protein [unclassified Microbacterium]MCR2812379.1 hypothetical protein [Microbacterium sp. zg.Y1084]MCR2817820.1 hypothetical protein [Microbacterium sp. zg.Y1090]MDL5485536.1 hypothetical protein [Microbacterium sp. zg-Y1211]WIM28707.1 hypothetical protein QNO26_02090 [Microbacterium sp. zg-Y1090]
MGLLYYGADKTPAEIPDRLLAHVKVVTATKLRRSESFTLSWRHPDGDERGRTTLWMQPSIPLRFVFESPEPETLDPELLRDLAAMANSSAGLSLAWADEPLATIAPAARQPLAA